jgi:hypothetical protein
MEDKDNLFYFGVIARRPVLFRVASFASMARGITLEKGRKHAQ